jgi:SSS family solute:Na+ symporter
VNVGRISSGVALIIGAIMAPLLGGIEQAFQFIQEYTGIVSPGILAIFLLGLFWKKTTNKAAIWGAIISIPIALYFKVGPKEWVSGTTFENIFPSVPFLNQMGLTLLSTIFLMMVLSWFENRGAQDAKGFDLQKATFVTSQTYNISAFVIMIILAFLYAFFW